MEGSLLHRTTKVRRLNQQPMINIYFQINLDKSVAGHAIFAQARDQGLRHIRSLLRTAPAVADLGKMRDGIMSMAPRSRHGETGAVKSARFLLAKTGTERLRLLVEGDQLAA